MLPDADIVSGLIITAFTSFGTRARVLTVLGVEIGHCTNKLPAPITTEFATAATATCTFPLAATIATLLVPLDICDDVALIPVS
jgi:hypothetical protein